MKKNYVLQVKQTEILVSIDRLKPCFTEALINQPNGITDVPNNISDVPVNIPVIPINKPQESSKQSRRGRPIRLPVRFQ